MKDRPILMTPENAQKCHDGTKTMTRRIVKLPRDRGTWEPFFFEGSKCTTSAGKPGTDIVCITNTKTGKTIACQFGQVGERIWVREPHAWPGEEAYLFRGNPEHRAIVEKWRADPAYPQIKWTPSIHMKRAACRTVLEITEVRVERLNEISHEDALAEGCAGQGWHVSDERHPVIYPFDEFRALWESINGPESWGLNPWVWVIAFKKVN